MRHNKKFNHLGRKSQHRKLMLSNMACSLIMHKRISTTVAKAKALRIFVEPIVTRAKVDSQHTRRMAFADLRNKYAVTELFTSVAPKVGDRPGGYTRIVRTMLRQGDNADMCLMELVDFNEGYTQARGTSVRSNEKTAKRTRRGRGSSKSSATSTKQDAGEASAAVDKAVDAPVSADAAQ